MVILNRVHCLGQFWMSSINGLHHLYAHGLSMNVFVCGMKEQDTILIGKLKLKPQCISGLFRLIPTLVGRV